MSQFQSLLRSDMEAAFCNLDEYGELIDYRPLTGPVFSVQAIVLRPPPEKVGVSPRLQASHIQIDIPKNNIPARPVLDGDLVLLQGETKWRTAAKLLDESDPGAWHLIVN
jgi:hypothetical protein